MDKLNYQFSTSELRSLLFDYNKMVTDIHQDCPTEVHIWDETLRDGEQTPGVSLNVQDKVDIAKLFNDIGIDKFAAGFPAVSQNEFESVKAIQELGLDKSKVLAIARPKKEDIDACLNCDLEEIVIFMPISDLMMTILKETPDTELEKIQEIFDYTRSHGLRFNWVSEDCTRSRPEHMIRVFKLAIENNAECIVIGDTVGVLQPHTTAWLMEYIKKELDWNNGHGKNKIPIGIHTHNDYGLAVANTLVAVYHGATYPHVCVNGYGERAGNAAFEEVVMNLERMKIKTSIDLSKITELSVSVEEKFNLPLSAHKPIVGDNAFSHESGLHINAIIAHPMSYEPINPSKIGQTRRLYLGKFSGTGSIVNALKTKLESSNLKIPEHIIREILMDVKMVGENASQQEKRQLFQQTKALNIKLRSGISDKEFFKIVKKHAAEYLKGTWADSGENSK